MAIEMKRCKVYPRNGLQFIPGILEKQKRIEFPAELPLSPKEIRRCLSYADVYEVTDAGDVLLTLENFMADNIVYHKDTSIQLDFTYTEKNLDEQDKIENEILSDIAWNKTDETYLENEDVWQVSYFFEI